MKVTNNTLIAAEQEFDWTSEGIFVGRATQLAVQLVFETTGATVKMQVSLDKGDDGNPDQAARDNSVVNWTDVTDSITEVTEDGDLVYDVADVTFSWFRIVIEGDGTLTSARFNTKGL